MALVIDPIVSDMGPIASDIGPIASDKEVLQIGSAGMKHGVFLRKSENFGEFESTAGR